MRYQSHLNLSSARGVGDSSEPNEPPGSVIDVKFKIGGTSFTSGKYKLYSVWSSSRHQGQSLLSTID